MQRYVRQAGMAAIAFVALSVGVAHAANAATTAVIAYMNLLDPALVMELEADGREGAELAFALVDRLQTSGVLDPAVHAQMYAALGEVPTSPGWRTQRQCRSVRVGFRWERRCFDVRVQIPPPPEVPLDPALLALFLLDVTTGTQPLNQVLAEFGFITDASAPLTGDSLLATLRAMRILTEDVDAALAAVAPGLKLPAVDSRTGRISSDGIQATIREVLETPDVVAGIRDGYQAAISPVAAGSLAQRR